MSDPTIHTPHPDDDPDTREQVRRVQEGHDDAGPFTGVVTDELKEASTPSE